MIVAYLGLLLFILNQFHNTSKKTLLLGYENAGLLAVQQKLIEAKNALIKDLAAAQRLSDQKCAEEGGCTLVCAIEPGLPALRADSRALKQILLNLLSNAIKFTLPGGLVTAFVRLRADGRMELGVSDTGVGIAPEDQPRVFEKFSQGRHAHVPKERGTGLGLSIVQGLVLAHGGEVTLNSTPQVGTTVTVTLPVERVIQTPSGTARSVA
jgi:signal transduction histidine kinase